MNIVKKLIKKICSMFIYPIVALILKTKKTNITDVLADDSLEELHDFSADPENSCIYEMSEKRMNSAVSDGMGGGMTWILLFRLTMLKNMLSNAWSQY